MKHVIFMNHLFFWVMRYFTPRFLYTKPSWSKRNPLTKTKGRSNDAAAVDASLRWTWCTWATDKILKKSHQRWADASTFFQRGFFWGGVGMVGCGLRCYFRKMPKADVVVEMTNASIKLELFQLVVTLRDGTISKGFGGASGRCRSAFQPLKLHRGEVLL